MKAITILCLCLSFNCSAQYIDKQRISDLIDGGILIEQIFKNGTMNKTLHYYTKDFTFLCRQKHKRPAPALGENLFMLDTKYKKCKNCIKKMKGTELEKYCP